MHCGVQCSAVYYDALCIPVHYNALQCCALYSSAFSPPAAPMPFPQLTDAPDSGFNILIVELSGWKILEDFGGSIDLSFEV